MREQLFEARITLEIEGIDIREAVCYRFPEEERVLMDFAREKIREGIEDRLKEEGNFFKRLGLKLMRKNLPKGKALMRVIVEKANDYYKRHDRLPENWQQFRQWAIARGFLSIKEVERREEATGCR